MLKIATQEDFDKIKPMAEKFFKTSPYADFPFEDLIFNMYIKSHLEGSPFKMIVMDILEDGTPTGFIAFEYGHWLFSPIACGIEKAMWVEEKYRDKDVAKELLKSFEDWATEMKVGILQLSTLEGEFAKPLDKFYKKMGYVKVEHTFLKKV